MNDLSRHGRMLQALAEIGVSRRVIGTTIDAFMPDTLSLDDRRFLMGPLVVHQNGWTDTLPVWLHDQVCAERVGIVFGLTPEYIVGPAEIAAVMYPATMAAPIGHYYADLYCWGTIHADAKRKNEKPEVGFARLGMRPITDADVVVRGGRLWETYRELATDIRRRVISQQIMRDRAEKREHRQEQKVAENGHDTPSAAEPASVDVQTYLFDMFAPAGKANRHD
jgi:hypothetical protein